MALKTNFKDDILDPSMNGQRQYQLIENDNETVSLKDKTVYTQEGDILTAEIVNEAFAKINKFDTRIIVSSKEPVSQDEGEVWEQIITLDSEDSDS